MLYAGAIVENKWIGQGKSWKKGCIPGQPWTEWTDYPAFHDGEELFKEFPWFPFYIRGHRTWWKAQWRWRHKLLMRTGCHTLWRFWPCMIYILLLDYGTNAVALSWSQVMWNSSCVYGYRGRTNAKYIYNNKIPSFPCPYRDILYCQSTLCVPALVTVSGPSHKKYHLSDDGTASLSVYQRLEQRPVNIMHVKQIRPRSCWWAIQSGLPSKQALSDQVRDAYGLDVDIWNIRRETDSNKEKPAGISASYGRTTAGGKGRYVDYR